MVQTTRRSAGQHQAEQRDEQFKCGIALQRSRRHRAHPAGERRPGGETAHECREHDARRGHRVPERKPEQTDPDDLIDERGSARRGVACEKDSPAGACRSDAFRRRAVTR